MQQQSYCPSWRNPILKYSCLSVCFIFTSLIYMLWPEPAIITRVSLSKIGVYIWHTRFIVFSEDCGTINMNIKP